MGHLNAFPLYTFYINYTIYSIDNSILFSYSIYDSSNNMTTQTHAGKLRLPRENKLLHFDVHANIFFADLR